MGCVCADSTVLCGYSISVRGYLVHCIVHCVLCIVLFTHQSVCLMIWNVIPTDWCGFRTQSTELGQQYDHQTTAMGHCRFAPSWCVDDTFITIVVKGTPSHDYALMRGYEFD